MQADRAPLPPQQTDKRPAFPSSVPTPQQELLIIEPESLAVEHAAVLRRDYRVSTTTDGGVALEYLNRSAISLVLLDVDSHGGAGLEICVTARALRPAATVLITTAKTAAVPDMLVAGCDAVLLKPFAANLLYARIGRLMRTRNEQSVPHANGNGNGNGDGAAALAASTNRTWPETACPTCDRRGAVSFEFSSYRRSWYACLACKHVWIAKRQE